MNTYIDFNKENNKEGLKFEFGDHVRISKYKNIFAQGYTPNQSEEDCVIKKLKIMRYEHMLLVMLTVKKLLDSFMKKKCKNQIKKTLELKK